MLLSNIVYQTLPVPSDVAMYGDALKKLYKNGKVITCLFEPVDKDRYEEALICSRDKGIQYEIDSFIKWLSASGVGETLKVLSTPKVVELGGFSCEGALTEILCFGGAYSRMDNDIDAARALSNSCMRSVFGKKLHKIRAYLTHDVWCSWFHNSGWDVTVFANDYISGRWWLLCATDSD